MVFFVVPSKLISVERMNPRMCVCVYVCCAINKWKKTQRKQKCVWEKTMPNYHVEKSGQPNFIHWMMTRRNPKKTKQKSIIYPFVNDADDVDDEYDTC